MLGLIAHTIFAHIGLNTQSCIIWKLSIAPEAATQILKASICIVSINNCFMDIQVLIIVQTVGIFCITVPF